MFETTLILPRTSVALTETLGSAGGGASTSTAAVAVQTSKRRRRRRNKRRRKSSLSSSNEAPSSRTYDPVMTGSGFRSGVSAASSGSVRRGRHRSGVSSSSSAAAAAAASPLSGGSSPSMFVDPQDYVETLD